MVNTFRTIFKQFSAWQDYFEPWIRDWWDSLIYKKYRHEIITKIKKDNYV